MTINYKSAMKGKVLVLLLMSGLPFAVMAQSNDDLYFVPKKEKKAENATVVSKQSDSNTKLTEQTSSTPAIVVKDNSGQTRDIDEYNRRYTSKNYTFKNEGDALVIEEKPYEERGEWIGGFEGSGSDYEYAMRIVRFRNPRYAIPVSSPLYWDVIYGLYPSWDWNIYDDGLYAYVFPTYSNPLWWDWHARWGIYGAGWSFTWGWRSPWYYGWYDPFWYGPYWGGYWGPVWHHHPYYSYYGGPGRWARPGYTDRRPGRYQTRPATSYNRNYSVAHGSSGINRSSAVSRNSSVRSRSASTRSLGRVVRSSDRTNGVERVTRSVRPGSATIRNSSASRSTVRPNASYMRPGTTSTTRTRSSYNRPSSTRSTYQRNSSSTRSTFNRSTTNSQVGRSSGTTTTRSSGGGVSRSTGGSRSRR